VIAALLLSLLFASLTPVLLRWQQMQAEFDQRTLALQELRNLAERGLYLHDPPERWQLPPDLTDRLPAAELTVATTTTPSDSLPNQQRITLQLSWQTGPSDRRATVQLHYWETEMTPPEEADKPTSLGPDNPEGR
jgi:type II secretory pathway pseudopilin PulG